MHSLWLGAEFIANKTNSNLTKQIEIQKSNSENLDYNLSLNDNPNFLEGHQIFCIINPYLYL